MAKYLGDSDPNQMPFGKKNFLFLGIGVFFIFLGFLLMSMDTEFIDATKYSTSLYISPVAIILGFAVVAYAIMLNPGKSKDSSENS